MPLYEYVCQSCDHRFEELVSASGTTIVTCPHCQTVDVEKLLSKFARTRGGAAASDGPAPAAPRSGGCCGGGCGCH